MLTVSLKPRDQAGPKVAEIQQAWGAAAQRGCLVRVLTQSTDQNLRAACELHELGVQVRLSDNLELGAFSYHVFRRAAGTMVLLNQPKESKRTARPAALESIPVARILLRSFDAVWRESRPLDDVLVAKIVAAIGSPEPSGRTRRQLEDLCTAYEVGDRLRKEVELKVAVLGTAQCIFIIGLPGAGKSTMRSALEKTLTQRGFRVASLPDYPYLFLQFLSEVSKRGASTARFEPDGRGGFIARDEREMNQALYRVNAEAIAHLSGGDVVLIEFARRDLRAALSRFDASVTRRARLVYLTASPEVRRARILARSRPPEYFVSGFEVGARVSDDHFLGSGAAQRLYTSDDWADLRTDPVWSSRLDYVDTEQSLSTLPGVLNWAETYVERLHQSYRHALRYSS